MIRRAQTGFTLLEVLVALAIGAGALGIAIAWTGELLDRQSGLIDRARLSLSAQSALEEWRTTALQGTRHETSPAPDSVAIGTSRVPAPSNATAPASGVVLERGRLVARIESGSPQAYRLDAIRLGRASE